METITNELTVIPRTIGMMTRMMNAVNIEDAVIVSEEEQEEQLLFEQPVQHDVWEGIRKLKPKYRIVVYLFYYEGYAIKEIADILHISGTAVTTRLSRARRLLEETLKDEV